MTVPGAPTVIPPAVSATAAGPLRFLPWAAFFASLLVFEWVWGLRYYGAASHVGHDFALTTTSLIEGRNWMLANGWFRGLVSPPWFTPAWCAGAALYADPQSAFYSSLQLFGLWLDPIAATHANALFFVVIAYGSCYLLARRCFGWAPAGAIVFAILGMANAFMPWRSVVGEAGYQPLYLWPCVAMALCWKPAAGPGWRAQLAPSVGVALCLTVWLQAGFAGMMVPVYLGVIVLCLVLVLQRRASFLDLVARSAMGGLLAIVLNASKLYESTRLLRNFPRDFYGMPGFDSPRDALAYTVLALIQPSQWTAAGAAQRMSGVRFSVLPHEWNLNFGLGAATASVLALAVGVWLRRGTTLAGRRPTGVSVAVSALVVLLLSVAPLLLWNEGTLRAWIKHVPVLSSTSWPMRWIVIWLPIAQWALAAPLRPLLERLRPARQAAVVVLVGATIWAGPLTEPSDYYASPVMQPYDPKPAARAFSRPSAEGPVPIRSIVVPEDGHLRADRNDSMFEGVSQAFCYNPIYGYRLEAFPQPERMRSDDALALDDAGRSLLMNPACLVHPEANACRPGDGFRMDTAAERASAQDFLSRRPFPWTRPPLGTLLSWTTQVAWVVLLFAIAVWARTKLTRSAARTR